MYIMAPILSGYGDSVFLALIYSPLFFSMRKKENLEWVSSSLGRGEMGCLKIQKDIPLFLRDVVSL